MAWQEDLRSDRYFAHYQNTYWGKDEEVPDHLTKSGISIKDIPQDAQRDLADKSGLELKEIADWVYSIKIDKKEKNIHVTVEMVWLNSIKENWSWEKDITSTEVFSKFRCPGWKCSKEILEKIRAGKVVAEDLGPTGIKKLSEFTKIDEKEFPHWVDKVETGAPYTGLWVRISINNVWLNSLKDNWDWKKDSATNDEDLGVFYCPGWKCTKAILDKIKNNEIKVEDIPSEGQSSLAKEVELEVASTAHWIYCIEATAKYTGIQVKISAPNIWISANLFSGGEWWEPPVFEFLGGFVPQLPTRLFTVKKKVIYCDTFNDLEHTLINKKRKVWGLIVHAHGNQRGIITANKDAFAQVHWQIRLIYILKTYNYKLARICMMQCYSGYKGNIDSGSWARGLLVQGMTPVKAVEQWLRWNFGNTIGNINVSIQPATFSATFDINWDDEWKSVGKNVFTYQGQNFALLDTGDNWFLWLYENGILAPINYLGKVIKKWFS